MVVATFWTRCSLPVCPFALFTPLLAAVCSPLVLGALCCSLNMLCNVLSMLSPPPHPPVLPDLLALEMYSQKTHELIYFPPESTTIKHPNSPESYWQRVSSLSPALRYITWDQMCSRPAADYWLITVNRVLVPQVAERDILLFLLLLLLFSSFVESHRRTYCRRLSASPVGHYLIILSVVTFPLFVVDSES